MRSVAWPEQECRKHRVFGQSKRLSKGTTGVRRWAEQGGYDVPKVERPGIAFAKTTRPTIGSAVEREGLFARLDAPPGRTVAWISGPPGAGKTTLAASYVRARGMQSVWYQVDADDADPASFFHYLRHALGKLGGARARELPSYTPQHANDVASFARTFFRQVFGSLTAPLTIVLDNLHAVAADGALHAVFDAGFSQVPKGSCVIVTSRAGPFASLAKLQAAGQLCHVGGAELRVGPDDIVAIAALRGQIVAPEAAAKLHERTQGWAAGLVLMLEHSKFSGRIVDVPGDTTPQVIFDFLAGEIFDRFEPRTREFLLRIACLPRMTAAVAATLSGDVHAERLLINLVRNDYFVREAAFEGGRVFQPHPLLREFLHNRAAQSMPEVLTGAWLRRAALLAQDAGQTEDAVALLVDTGDWSEVARIALDEAEALLAQGRSATLAAWIELLPPTLVEAEPRLLLVWATSMTYTSPRAARQRFERAFEGYRTGADVEGMMRCCCGVVDAIVSEFDDLTPLDRWVETLHGLLGESGAAWSGPIAAIAATTLVRATLLRAPESPRIADWLERAERTVQSTAMQLPVTVRAEVTLARAMVALSRGEMATADSAFDALRGEAASLPSNQRLALAIAVGLSHLVSGSYTRAREVTQDALTAAAAEGIRAYDEWLWALSAVACLCAGDRIGARASLERLAADGTKLRRGDRGCVCFVRACLTAFEGDIVVAQREAKLALAVAVETGIPWFEALARVALAQLQVAGADRRAMEAQLRGAEALAERMRSPWLRCGVHLAASAAAWEQGQQPQALDRLRAGLLLGYEHGIRPPPGWRPQILAELCSHALEAQVQPEFARTLIREGNLVPRAPPLLIRGWPWTIRITCLGEFQCLRGETPIELSGKGPGRPMELLKVLIALGRHNVRSEQLADALWPHMEADYAYKSFTATLHRLRRSLEEEDALVLRDGRLTLNKAMIWVDTWALEQLFDDFEAARRDSALNGELRNRKFTEDALAIYRGPFLPDESEQPCYIACREQIRGKLLRFLVAMARGYEADGMPEAAAGAYLRFIEADELCEPLYRQLMLCYERSGAPADALTTYERLRTILSMRLKTMPSLETQALYARLKSGGSATAVQ
jgi:LuxR family transcriptional regulator, maltose regulon positive regulatory protein